MAASYRVIATRICRPENDRVSTQVVIAGWCPERESKDQDLQALQACGFEKTPGKAPTV
jgi:hypothetical protein